MLVGEGDRQLSARVRMERRLLVDAEGVRLRAADSVPGEVRLHGEEPRRLRAVAQYRVQGVEVDFGRLVLLSREPAVGQATRTAVEGAVALVHETGRMVPKELQIRNQLEQVAAQRVEL